jgi:hypothetical protein
MSWLLALVFTGAVSYGPSMTPLDASSRLHPTALRPARELLASDTRRVRTSERRILRLLDDGVRRSKTFAELVSQIHRTDVIVYVETTNQLGHDTVGRLLLQTVAGRQRYLRVQVRSGLQGDQIIAVIGHELHHALEVAEDRSVVDDMSLTALYRRIGHFSQGSRGFDTDGARAAGIRVRDELIS